MPGPCLCGKPVRANQKSLACIACDVKYHQTCLVIDANVLKALSEANIPPWTCKNCILSFKNLINENSKLAEENCALKKNNESLLQRIDSFEKKLTDMKNDIKNEILSELKQNIPSNPTQGLSVNNVVPIASNEEIRKEIHMAMIEDREREKRRLNLCIRNLPEVETDEQSSDLAMVKDFLTENLEIQRGEIAEGLQSVKRLGERQDSKARVLIASCKTSSIRRKILQNSRKLKDFRTAENKKVFIVPDMTKTQMETDKKLNDELWSLRREGVKAIIRRGRIVVLDEQSNEISQE